MSSFHRPAGSLDEVWLGHAASSACASRVPPKPFQQITDGVLRAVAMAEKIGLQRSGGLAGFAVPIDNDDAETLKLPAISIDSN